MIYSINILLESQEAIDAALSMMAFQFYIWLSAKNEVNFVPFASGVVVVDEVSNAEVICNVAVVVLPFKEEVSCAKHISRGKT